MLSKVIGRNKSMGGKRGEVRKRLTKWEREGRNPDSTHAVRGETARRTWQQSERGAFLPPMKRKECRG